MLFNQLYLQECMKEERIEKYENVLIILKY